MDSPSGGGMATLGTVAINCERLSPKHSCASKCPSEAIDVADSSFALVRRRL